MRKVWLVAAREYGESVKTRAFLLGVLLTPLMMIGMIFMTKMLDRQGDIQVLPDRTVLVQDGSGELGEAMRAAVERHNESLPNQKLILEWVRADDAGVEAAISVAKERVRRGEAKGLLVIAATTVSEGTPPGLYVNRTGDMEFFGLMRQMVTQAVQQRRGEALNLSVEAVKKLAERIEPQLFDITSAGKQTDRITAMMTPFAFLFLMFMGVFGISQGLLTSVIEEKSSRVMEVLLSGLSSGQLMAGKILGMALVGFTLMGLWVGAGYLTATYKNVEYLLRLSHPGWFILYYILGFMLLSSLLAALGSAVNSLKEAQSLMSPITMLMIVPMLAWFFILQYPNSTWVTAMSFFPPLTPFVMVLRLSGSEPVPGWQLPATTAVLAAGALATLWLSGRVFRVGVLMYGKPPTPREILRWVTYR